VPLPLGDFAEVDHQRRGEWVPGQDVMGGRHHDRGRVDAVEDTPQVGLHLLRRAAARPRRRTGELIHVGALVVVEAQDAGQRRQHRRGGVDPALLEPGAVVGRDRRQLGDLLAAEAGDPPLGPTLGQVDVARAELVLTWDGCSQEEPSLAGSG
jgi:hypothetical protein